MKCPDCNTYNNYYHNFCYNCGKQLLADMQEKEKYNVGNTMYHIILNKGRKDANPYRDLKRNRIVWLLVTLLVILLITMLFFSLSMGYINIR